MTAVNTRTRKLAIDGGTPVRRHDRRWPVWPIPAEDAQRLLGAVLGSGRWAISSPQGEELFERRFARMFAAYVGTRNCVPVDHGSSALVIALESLGLDHGDAVLVPALTWTASATAVLRAGLVPVLVDVEAGTGCIGPESLEAGVDARAVIAVHWACAMADIPAIAEAAAVRGMTVIEDAAQAHGAQWRGRSAGSLARLGCFSFQHGKVLTGGEGGAVVTDDDGLACLLEELRADSRRYRAQQGAPGELELVETATVMGANFCLSEFDAAVLCAQLGPLDAQHQVRNRNYARLGQLIAGIPGVRLLQPRHEQTRTSVYEGTIVFDRLPEGMSNRQVAAALTAELGVRIYATDEPLHRSRLLRPWTKPAMAPLTRRFVESQQGRTYPNTDYLADHCVQTHHSTFLGDERDMVDFAEAIAKVAGNRAHGDRTEEGRA